MKEFIKKNWILFFIFITVLGLSYNIYNDNRRNTLFKKSKLTQGFLVKEDHSSNRFLVGYFKFSFNHKAYIFRHKGDFSFLKVGDTVLIEYAIDDPTVARVKDRYYMKKFNYIKMKLKLH